MYIPKGRYLTLEQFRLKIGGVAKSTVLKAIKQDRLKGTIRLDEKTILIPEDAILVDGRIKHGRYIGMGAWLRGNEEDQGEYEKWETKQAQLRKMREGDIGEEPPEDYNDYD